MGEAVGERGEGENDEAGQAWISQADALIGAVEDEMFSPLSREERVTLLRLMSVLFVQHET